MRTYTLGWENIYDFYECKLTDKTPDNWCMKVKNNDKQLLVFKQNNTVMSPLIETNKEALIQILKTYNDQNFLIVYKDVDYTLIGYLLDFFIYYVDMPDKIKSED